jgi:hypothetical protein
VTGVFEFALEDALLADRFSTFRGPRGLTCQQAEQDAIVIEEERACIRVDDQPSLAPQVGLDRKGDGRVAGRILANARRGAVIRRPDLLWRRWRPVDDPDSRRRTERDDRRRSIRDRPSRVCECDPERVRVPVDRRAEEALAEVEGDRPLLEPAKRDRRDERGQIAQTGHECQDPGDRRDARVGGPAARGSGRSRPRNKDRDGEADRRRSRDPQSRTGITDAVAGGAEEKERRDRLDREEVRDDEERDRWVAACPDPDPDDGQSEPDKRQNRQRPRHADEMGREP